MKGSIYDFLKRTFDVVGASVGLVVGFPLMLIIAILVKVKLGNPIFFRQIRPGLHAQPFILYKFRTMKDAGDARGVVLSDEERLTQFGRLLRSTSLDELPQLFNVLRGDMSFIGPRPLLMEYLSVYTPSQARRHEVKPGITGWSQVKGRNSLDWQERLALDVWYVEQRSLRLDLQILVQTIWIVLTRQGISAHGSATMPRLTDEVSKVQETSER